MPEIPLVLTAFQSLLVIRRSLVGWEKEHADSCWTIRVITGIVPACGLPVVPKAARFNFATRTFLPSISLNTASPTGMIVSCAGKVPQWMPFMGGNPRWNLESAIASSRSQTGSSQDGAGPFPGVEDDADIPDLIADEPDGSEDYSAGNDEPSLMWDTRPKSPDRLVFDSVFGVVPAGLLRKWEASVDDRTRREALWEDLASEEEELASEKVAQDAQDDDAPYDGDSEMS